MGRFFKFAVHGIEDVLRKLERATEPFTQKECEQIGQAVIAAMKQSIASGNSPIAGWGRFPAYKDPKRYPGNHKPKSPVNLKLSGDFLNSLTYSIFPHKSGRGFEVAFFYRGSDQNIKEVGHRRGANTQPQRPTIPDASQGEKFSRLVEDAYMRVASQVVKRRTNS